MNRKFYGMHSFLRFAALAALIAIPACADVFSVKGVFDNTSFAGPLNGGSFSGIFSVTGLPVANGSEVLLTSWDVILRDASHTILAELTSEWLLCLQQCGWPIR